tara:strand:- start:1402 stop:1566 length:165 start_codon:yes stop_codon:yes gene_type:complete
MTPVKLKIYAKPSISYQDQLDKLLNFAVMKITGGVGLIKLLRFGWNNLILTPSN